MTPDQLKKLKQEAKNFNYEGALKSAVTNYKTAVSYYKNQKKQFMEMLNSTNKEALQINEKELLSQLTEQINMEYYDENTELSNLTEKFYNKVENFATKYINYKSTQAAKNELNSIKKDTTQREKYAKQEAKKQSEKIQRILEKQLTGKQIAFIRRRIDDIYRTVYDVNPDKVSSGAGYGMFRRALIKELTGNKYELSSHSKGGYTKILGGYYKEIALANVFKKWVEQTDLKVSQVGVEGGKTDIGIGIGEINEIEAKLKKLEELSTTIVSDENLKQALTTLSVFGIQSKSWGIPEDAIITRKNMYSKGFMSIGHHEALYNSMAVSNQEPTIYRGLYYNIFQMSRYLITAIGAANVLYSLKGNQMMWTHELIENLMSKKYYLAFWFTRKNKKFIYPATTELAWQRIDNRKIYTKNNK